ncbi:unnamed protein product [Owenia fusiformis]|uniref:Gamma-aminobutyric acid type B receptor subunit 2 n=1 Tax=Owenia fusiformis TaxID=6347 RepID=A0A8J1TJD8_OWEFU|nr:unnamed protein product [Owenia fusiformis]
MVAHPVWTLRDLFMIAVKLQLLTSFTMADRTRTRPRSDEAEMRRTSEFITSHKNRSSNIIHTVSPSPVLIKTRSIKNDGRDDSSAMSNLPSVQSSSVPVKDPSTIPKRSTDTVKLRFKANKNRTIYLGGLFELSGANFMHHGHSELAAAKLAVKHVNEQNIIPGYQLNLLHRDTKCDPGTGADEFYHMIYSDNPLTMVLGSACSEVTKMVGEIVPYWNLMMVSFAASSPALSDREKYPTFYRLAVADSSHNQARKMLIQHFGWTKVAAIHQDMEMFSLAMNDMIGVFDKANITVKPTLTFRHGNEGNDLESKIQELKEEDVRVFIGSFQENAARQVFCQAYKAGLYGRRYVWVLLGWYTEDWWQVEGETNCTKQEMATAVNGYIGVDGLNSIIGQKRSISGLSTEMFFESYKRYGGPRPISPFATVTYDTIWTVALTLNNSLKMMKERLNQNIPLTAFNYKGNMSGEWLHTFFRAMGDLEFVGVSGPVSFKGPDRRGITVFKQNQNGTERRFALFYPENNTLDFNCSGCVEPIWKGGRIPVDSYTILTRDIVIEGLTFFLMCGLSFAGMVLAVTFLIFNIYYRRLKYIKLSSPKLNNVAVVGCLLVYIGVMLLGVDNNAVLEQAYPVVCTVRAFLFSAGFSLAFGAMFTKTYRVYQIFTRVNRGLLKSKLLKDKQLLFIIGALLIVDVIVISLWVLVDPMYKSVSNFTIVSSENDPDLLYIPQLATCDSVHMIKWTGALYAYKGLLLMFGVYMAWATRHVKIPALNDSQYIGMNVYNVVTVSVIVVALSSILNEQPTLSYVIISSFVLLSTTASLCLLFVPKIYFIIKSDGNPIITTSGLMVEANVRRFAVDEKKEMYYRAEVQNRVYKRELVELEQEICRLERLVEMSDDEMDEELYFLYPEGNVDSTPLLKKRIEYTRQRYDSISDEDDVTCGLSSPDGSKNVYNHVKNKRRHDKKVKRQLKRGRSETEDSGFHTMSIKKADMLTVCEDLTDDTTPPCTEDPSHAWSRSTSLPMCNAPSKPPPIVLNNSKAMSVRLKAAGLDPVAETEAPFHVIKNQCRVTDDQTEHKSEMCNHVTKANPPNNLPIGSPCFNPGYHNTGHDRHDNHNTTIECKDPFKLRSENLGGTPPPVTTTFHDPWEVNPHHKETYTPKHIRPERSLMYDFSDDFLYELPSMKPVGNVIHNNKMPPVFQNDSFIKLVDIADNKPESHACITNDHIPDTLTHEQETQTTDIDKINDPVPNNNGQDNAVAHNCLNDRGLKRRKKIKALQGELAKIQRELKSLSDLEFDITYV